MLRPAVYILFVLLAVSGQTLAQKGSKKKKAEKKDKGTELITIYLKKKLVYTFTKEEYLHFRDSINHQTSDALHRVNEHKIEWKPSAKKPVALLEEETGGEPVNIYREDRLIQTLRPAAYRRFRDSVATRTKDTIFAINDMRVEIHSYQAGNKTAKPGKPSIFINREGYVMILLPQVKMHTYRVVFFADATELFQLKNIGEAELTLDKTNFMHAGWFSYELYEDEKIKEKGRLFLPK